MNYPIRWTSAALRDLEEPGFWIAEHDSPEKAGYVLDRLDESIAKLSTMPRRGSHPHELPPGTEAEFRQIFFKPYRIIYEVAAREVIIHALVDGRRNLQSLLLRRLLGKH
jgi:toxin ParE1/3/4